MTRAVNTALAGSGGVLQVVQASYTTLNTIVSSTAYGNVFSVSITPTSSSNKILVIGSLNAVASIRAGSRSSIFSRWALFRNGTAGTKLYESLIGSDFSTTSPTLYFAQANNAICYLDSPATTSTTTYNVAIASRSDTTDLCTLVNSNNADNPGSSPSSYVVALEIAG